MLIRSGDRTGGIFRGPLEVPLAQVAEHQRVSQAAARTLQRVRRIAADAVKHTLTPLPASHRHQCPHIYVHQRTVLESYSVPLLYCVALAGLGAMNGPVPR